MLKDSSECPSTLHYLSYPLAQRSRNQGGRGGRSQAVCIFSSELEGAPEWNLPCPSLLALGMGEGLSDIVKMVTQFPYCWDRGGHWAVLLVFEFSVAIDHPDPKCVFCRTISWQVLEERRLLITSICSTWPLCTLASDVENGSCAVLRDPMDMSVWRVYWPCHLLRPLVESTEVLKGKEHAVPDRGPDAMQRKSSQIPASFFCLFSGSFYS